jgi:hypothetical protein
MCLHIILIFIIYNLLLFYSFGYNINKIIYYWRNIHLVGVPFDTDDFPYITKFDMLYILDNVCTIHPNIHQFITSTNIPKIYPTISLKSVWTDEFLIEMNKVLSNFDTIHKEIMNAVRNKYSILFDPIGKHYGDKEIKKWNSCHIIKDRKIGVGMEKYFPVTIQTIEKLKSFYGWLFISILEPGAHIPRHRGRYNHKLTCHIGIDGLDDCYFIIDGKKIKWERGQYFVFNDFSYHEVIHNGDKNRVVLIFDLFHPELTNEEIKQIKYIEI